MISVRELNKTYARHYGSSISALADVNLEIAERIRDVVGPSGCGKTTLLKILAGILHKSSGNVLVNGNPIEGPSRQLEVLFQEPLPLHWRNIIDNVCVSLVKWKLDPEDLVIPAGSVFWHKLNDFDHAAIIADEKAYKY